jgi:hypothetical protein
MRVRILLYVCRKLVDTPGVSTTHICSSMRTQTEVDTPWYFRLCPHTTTYVSSYYYVCVCNRAATELQHMQQSWREHLDTSVCVLILLHVSSYYYVCVCNRAATELQHMQQSCKILLHMRPHTITYVSSYYYICVRTLLYTWLELLNNSVRAPRCMVVEALSYWCMRP